MVRPPFSRRQSNDAASEFFILREGVPDGLVSTLAQFTIGYFYGHDRFAGAYRKTELHDAFARLTDQSLPTTQRTAAAYFGDNRELLLDAVDFLLGGRISGHHRGPNIAEELEAHLQESRSAYTVGTNASGHYELQQRQPQELTDLAETAASGTDRAGEHLRRAWSNAFGRNQDPNGACDEAVKAVEAAARQTVSPKNTKATLGTMIRDMKAAPGKWTTDSESKQDIESIISMMNMIWTGHYRHGDETEPIQVSEQGAEMIVQSASILVHWFRSGRISRI